MFVVADGDNARSKRQQAVEVLSLHMFGLADTGGKLITRRLVTERLAELAGHKDECQCGLCALLPLVTVSRVWRTANCWQADVKSDPTTGAALMDYPTRLAVLIIVDAMTERDELGRAVDDVNPLSALVNSLTDITLGALRELAQLRGTTVEACLMDLVDDG